jgi:hypothetical protein
VFKDDKTLVPFTPKKGKNAMLLSTTHVEKAVSEQMKPEIHFYNLTKGGVDSFDELVHNYSEKNFKEKEGVIYALNRDIQDKLLEMSETSTSFAQEGFVS